MREAVSSRDTQIANLQRKYKAQEGLFLFTILHLLIPFAASGENNKENLLNKSVRKAPPATPSHSAGPRDPTTPHIPTVRRSTLAPRLAASTNSLRTPMH